MDKSFFTGNRHSLVSQLQPNSLLVLAGFGSMQRDTDNPYEFQQESNFWYVCGIEEPDWRLIIDVDSGDEWLVAPTLNRFQQNFLGGYSAEQATAISGVTQVIEQPKGKELLQQLLAKKKHVYTLVPESLRVFKFQPNSAPRKLMPELKGSERVDVRPILNKLRGTKQPAEIKAIQEAVDITVDSLEAMFADIKSFKTENQIDAKLYYEFRSRGAVHGFDPIISSGAKNCVLHSKASNDRLSDWLLLDVGARVHNYTADITRTIPLRQPTDRETEVYHAVQRMHDHFLEVLKPGANVKDALMKDAYPFVGEEMVKLGLLKKPLLDHDHVFKFMPHGITHGLGIDAHDPLGRPETFTPGLVLTDEVGVYIPAEGIGIRIENDVVITEHGAVNMAARLPIDLGKVLY